jgi:hypothetical protein
MLKPLRATGVSKSAAASYSHPPCGRGRARPAVRPAASFRDATAEARCRRRSSIASPQRRLPLRSHPVCRLRGPRPAALSPNQGRDASATASEDAPLERLEQLFLRRQLGKAGDNMTLPSCTAAPAGRAGRASSSSQRQLIAVGDGSAEVFGHLLLNPQCSGGAGQIEAAWKGPPLLPSEQSCVVWREAEKPDQPSTINGEAAFRGRSCGLDWTWHINSTHGALPSAPFRPAP